jgi:ABC-type lipoprotein release transport system permease subunit
MTAPAPITPPTPRPLASRLPIFVHLAYHNVVRNARRSALTAAAMSLGLAFLVFARALNDGAHESWIRSGVRMGVGHVAIQAPGFQRSRSLADRLAASQVVAAESALAAVDIARGVDAVSPRLTVSGLASSAASALPVRIEGVDPEREARFSALPGSRVRGAWLTGDDPLGAYLGDALARRLRVVVGSRFVLTAQGADTQIAGQLVRVAGTFHTGVPGLDEGLVYLPLTTAQSWLGAPGAVTSVAVLLRSSRITERVAGALRPALRDGLAVLTWREAAPELDSGVRIDDYSGWIFMGILLAIVALAVLNAVLMSVLNRNREFGVLQALGLTRRETGMVVLIEGLMLTSASGVFGMLLGFGITWLFWRNGLDLTSFMKEGITVSNAVASPIIVPEFRVSQVVLSLTLTVLIGVLASLYPARQAGRIDVAEAMKFDR